MKIRIRHLVAVMALLAGLLVTPLLQTRPVTAQDDTGRTISLNIFRCPPGVGLQQMVAKDCTPVTAGVGVTITSINGSIAPLTIADATLDGNTFDWTATSSGSSTDEWGFTHGALPEGTTAFLLQGDGVVAGQSGAFDYRFTTNATSRSAFLDMYLLMAADAPIIPPPAQQPAENPAPAADDSNVLTPEATAGLRPAATNTPIIVATASSDSNVVASSDTPEQPVAPSDRSEAVSPADTGDVFDSGDRVVVAEGPLNLRAAAGTSAASVGSLAVGTELTIISGPLTANGYNWYRVQSDAGKSGWVIVDAIQLASTSDVNTEPDTDTTTELDTRFTAGDEVVVFDGPVNLRTTAGTSSAIVKSLPQETLLTITGGPDANGGYSWYQVRTSDGANGWIAADFISTVTVPAPPADAPFALGNRLIVVDGPMNLRSAAGTGNAMVAVLQTGDTMTVTDGPIAADGYTWYGVQTASGNSGWAASAFLDVLGFQAGDVVAVATDSLNVRAAAGLNSSVVQTIFEGTVAVVTDGPVAADGRNWYRIDVAGVTSGWVAGDYLVLSSTSPIEPSTGAYGPGEYIFVNDPPVNLRDMPSTSGQILASLGDGDGMLVLSDASVADGYTWNQVQFATQIGWIATEYVAGGFALGGPAIVADGPVNVRSAPGTANTIVTGLAQGAQITVLQIVPEVVDGVLWFQVTTSDDATGWVAGRYLGPVS